MRRADARSALRALPAGTAERVARLAENGDRLGLGVLLVGGPVRDLLLGRPLLDVDLIVEPRGGESHDPARRLAEAAAGPGDALVAHARFGTVTLAGAGGAIDLAAARAERYAAPGALPEVEAGTLEQDLARRDFSVNAMAIPLNEAARRGREALVDPLGGRRDLRARRLRILRARSFHDDPTRALRAARFSGRLGFALEPASRRALGEAIGARAFDAVSGERFRAELAKLFAGAHPDRALGALARWSVLGALARGLALAPEARRALAWLGRARAPAPPPDPLETGLCVWLAPLAPGVRRGALARFVLTGRPAERVAAFPALARRAMRALARAASRGAVDAVLRPLPPEELMALAAGAGAAARRRILVHAHEDRALRLPLDGDDLLALGLTGPEVGRALAALRRAVLDRKVAGRDEALAWMRERA